MDDIWESFPCQLGEHPAFIGFNHSFAQRAADGSAPQHFASFRVSLQAPNEAGFPAGAEFERLNQLEDLLSAGIEPAHGQQVGRTSCAGLRDFAFYTSLDEQQCWQLIATASQASGYAIELLHEHDPQYDNYWQSLYPSLDEWQVIKDLRAEQALRRHGDTLEEPRELQHWALFPSATARSEFLAQLPAGVDVQALYETEEQGELCFVSQLSHHGLADHRSISHITIPLARTAASCGGHYDGWQAELRPVTQA